MKSNFLKIVLPAFALMLAITASLAFTSAEEDITTENVYYADGSIAILLPATIDCNPNIVADLCTVQDGPNQVQVFYKDEETGEPTVTLYKDLP